MIASLISLIGLAAASVQDHLTGKVTKLVFWIPALCSTLYLTSLGWVNAAVHLLLGLTVYTVLGMYGMNDEWGGADTWALILVTMGLPLNKIWVGITLSGISVAVYSLYLDRKDRKLYVVPGITLGYILALAVINL